MSHVQGGWGGWPTGNGKKLSSSQAQLGKATCLAVAYFLSISGATSTPSALYSTNIGRLVPFQSLRSIFVQEFVIAFSHIAPPTFTSRGGCGKQEITELHLEDLIGGRTPLQWAFANEVGD